MVASVRVTVSTIFFVDWSMISWSKALRRMRMDCAMASVLLLDDLGDAAGADGAPTLTDGEPQTLIHRDRLAQLHRHRHIVTRHHHLRPLRQLDRPRHIRRPEKELRPIIVEERLVPTTLR